MDLQTFIFSSLSKALIHTFVLAERNRDRSVGKVVMLRATKPRNSNLIPRRARHCPVLESVCVDPAARVKHPGPEHPHPPGAKVNELVELYFQSPLRLHGSVQGQIDHT